MCKCKSEASDMFIKEFLNGLSFVKCVNEETSNKLFCYRIMNEDGTYVTIYHEDLPSKKLIRLVAWLLLSLPMPAMSENNMAELIRSILLKCETQSFTDKEYWEVLWRNRKQIDL